MNTRFLHLHASQRGRTNTISHILNSKDELITDQQQLDDLFSLFYSKLFISSHPYQMEECLQVVSKRVLDDMNQSQSVEYTDQEVTTAFFQMNFFGAPGPDGFPAHFFQKYQSTIKKDVCSFVLNVLNNNVSLPKINTTFIVLISKVKLAKRVQEFRPISL